MCDAFITTLTTAKTSEDRQPAADGIADLVVAGGPKALDDNKVFDKLTELMEMKKKPGAREGAC
eukprot:SAG25_NODE_6210_length_578_cov_1.288100_1_plen_63_part_01